MQIEMIKPGSDEFENPDYRGRRDDCRYHITRADQSGISMWMFTAKAHLEDKIKGFKMGADDYITKPI